MAEDSPTSSAPISPGPCVTATVEISSRPTSARSSASAAIASISSRWLRDAISEVSAEVVVEPIRAELVSYGEVRDGLSAALR